MFSGLESHLGEGGPFSRELFETKDLAQVQNQAWGRSPVPTNPNPSRSLRPATGQGPFVSRGLFRPRSGTVWGRRLSLSSSRVPT
mgnify:CR=1 FL=1